MCSHDTDINHVASAGMIRYHACNQMSVTFLSIILCNIQLLLRRRIIKMLLCGDVISFLVSKVGSES